VSKFVRKKSKVSNYSTQLAFLTPFAADLGQKKSGKPKIQALEFQTGVPRGYFLYGRMPCATVEVIQFDRFHILFPSLHVLNPAQGVVLRL
jgi:hypothetical protein